MRRNVILCSVPLLILVIGLGVVYALHRLSVYVYEHEVSIQKQESSTKITSVNLVWEIPQQVDKDRALTALRQLTGEAPICVDNRCYTIKDRFTGGEGLRWAEDYVYQGLVDLGYSVEIQDWSSSGYHDSNIIARRLGMAFPDEEVYFVAHMDGVKKDEEQSFPAADDNASGVVDILEVARVVSNYSFDRTLVFFFSTGEEVGRLGVNSYLQGLSQQELSSIKYVINVDMVGYDENRDGLMEIWHGDHPPSLALAQMMSGIIHNYHMGLTPGFVVGCG